MKEVLLVIHLLIALALIALVLMQRSEGGALGIGGGGGGAGNLFSARGVGNALTRTTAILAVAFFATSILLTVMATRQGTGISAFGGGAAPSSQQGTPPASGNVLPKLPEAPKVPVSQ
jgi:preprotein translocase subunit SecG